MKRTIYANLQLWDPMGQMKIAPGLIYGGQSMFFVVAADNLVSGLDRLLDTVAEKGLGLIRLMYAGYTDEFNPDHFPYEVDLAPMIKDAMELDKICALGPFTFDPAAAPEPAGVMLACVDVFEPRDNEAGPGTGALCLAAVQGSVADGLRALLREMQAKGVQLHLIEDAKDASEHSEVFSFETSVEDMVKRARETAAPVYSDTIGYEG